MHATVVAYDAYPLLDPSLSAGVGGAEVRAVTFARGLQIRHHTTIDIVVRDRPQLPSSMGPFRLIGYRKPRVHFARKIQQSLSKRFRQLPPQNSFYRSLNSDVVLLFGVRNETASIVRSLREAGQPCVVFLTSDRNLEDAMRQGKRDRGAYGELGYLCRYTLQHAHLVVAQTPFQQSQLQQSLGIASVLIRNPIDLSTPAAGGETAGINRRRDALAPILWVGRADTFSKRADLCLQLAACCPQYRFQMIMNNHDQETFDQIQRAAGPNVQIIEQVPFDQIESNFRNAQLLVNTSAAEGFPNSFLQACKHGKPIVSLDVDPGQMLSQFGCGVCANGDIQQMAAIVNSLIESSTTYNEVSRRARQYVSDYHDSVRCCALLHDELTNLIHHALRPVA